MTYLEKRARSSAPLSLCGAQLQAEQLAGGGKQSVRTERFFAHASAMLMLASPLAQALSKASSRVSKARSQPNRKEAGIFLPAKVTAEDDVTSEDGVRAHVLVDGVRDDSGGHGELDWGGVDNADDVAGSRGLEQAEEWPVAAVLGVQLDDLLVV
eukprot:CAMPEP_0119372566 /NCGR_PEP_ID=MMETSP1334-20130426/20299_1 /TAXON_ID=127549 /ORGANISM="Calcidiscus leptoporus, Strain RCC1130" /LENGTH=154 /DNA_ID=CAMNT_0007390087 /DNA_START=229 /DNA_END=692 /DNA_ORIENTATION=-